MIKKKEYFSELWDPRNYEALLKCMTVLSK